MQVILDTNFLIYCAENKVDYATNIMNLMNEGYELVVPNQVIIEIESIAKNAKKLSDRTAAFLALKLLEHNKVKVISSEGVYADEAIVNMVRRGSIVATLDFGLRKALKGKARIMIVNSKRELDFE
jgi:rRNA-processing protein FCF1